MSKGKHKGGAHGPGMMGSIEKPKNFKGTMKKLLTYLSTYKITILIIVIFSTGSTLFAIIGPKIMGMATTEIFNGMIDKNLGGSGINFSNIAKLLLFLACLYGISCIFNLLQGVIMAGVSQKMVYQLRGELSAKIHRLPMNYYDSKTHGEILSRITNDVDVLGMSLNQIVTQMISAVTTLLGITIMMLLISPTMTLIALISLPISGVLVAFIVTKSQKYFKQQQEYIGDVNGLVEEIYGGHQIIKLFNQEKAVIKEFEKSNDKLYESGWKSQLISGLIMPLMSFIGNVGYVAVAVLGGYLSIKGKISVGDIQSFIQYVRQFTQPVNQIAQISSVLQSTVAAAERVFEFLEEEEERKISKIANINPIDFVGDVKFEQVHFGYQPDKIIINDFTATIKAGQKVAIVGPTGAGKTTMVKLLMGFYDLNTGAIKIDGYNIKNFDRSELREAFGMVLQETWLFKGSIMDNIRYGRLDATDEEVIEAAKAAHAHYFIQALPGGYQMELNEEANNVSLGQKQLLTIARAILANNKILILDEATSSVDTRTEILIQKAMNHLMEGRTSFVIAHRLSTIIDADLILVMKEGDIIEQGSHKELIESKGYYSDLYYSQFEKMA